MAILLAIDISTSSAKALLFDSETTQILSIVSEEYPLLQPLPDRAEQRPADWWLSTVSVVEQCLHQANRRDVNAIGITGQMHGTVLLGVHGEVLHPAIIWADSRSSQISQEIMAKFGAEQYASIAGTLPFSGFMSSTLAWIKQHDPELLSRTKQVILPKDYVRMKLTGAVATDISDAAATGLFDITAGEWSAKLLDAIGLREDILPLVLPSTARAGELTTQAADALGLIPGIPVVVGCADQPAQALANGLIALGLISVTVGTGGQVFVPMKLPVAQPDPRVHVFNHAIPDMHYVLGAILAAGLNLRWLRNLLGMQEEAEAYARLGTAASKVPLGANGLLFLPYLIGERTPHMDSSARASFIGLRYFHERGHLARSVMEGVAFALRQALEISLTVGGISADKVIAAGGAMESDVWRQILADVLGFPLQKTLLKEQTCIGAALLAGVAIGAYTSLEEASRAVFQFDLMTEPDAENHNRYNELYQQFLELYPRLREDFHRLEQF